jgi:hypothetical protein
MALDEREDELREILNLMRHQRLALAGGGLGVRPLARRIRRWLGGWGGPAFAGAGGGDAVLIAAAARENEDSQGEKNQNADCMGETRFAHKQNVGGTLHGR